jgi:hypothetical protein
MVGEEAYMLGFCRDSLNSIAIQREVAPAVVAAL